MPRDEFGCGRCWPGSADAAREVSLTLEPEVELIDESHFRVVIRRCPACAQQFLSVFAETIDWANGEDPQYRAWLPVTAAEAAGLVRQGRGVDEATLNALGPGRRCLRHDHGAAEPPRSYWAAGMSVPPHD
ncbi:MAG TPA: hypothetical protein VFJ16_22830 [Longimicrobium sp.]|nr:hypothetical protein [Longimicrobium sp.]